MSARAAAFTRKPAKIGARTSLPSSSTWIALAPAFAFAIVLSACGDAAPAADGEATASASEAIYGGTLDNDSSQNSAVVSLRIGDGNPFELCSASLIAPNVVLTARHCVSVNITQAVACDSNGVSGNGPQLGQDEAVATIHVFVGPNPNFLGAPAANAKQIFHATTDVLCNGDIALVVLDRNIPGVTPIKVRLDSPTTSGEKLRAVGFGQNDKQLPVGTRLRKDNVGVLAVGKGVSANSTQLATNEFEVGLSICQGDSGGPAISETTGAVVGVVSRGGNCTDDFGHIYTTLGAFKSVFDAAFQVAGGAPIEEKSTAAPPPDAGAANGGGTGDGGSGGPNGGSPRPGVNLHAGQGAQGCSASGAPSPASTTFGGIAIGMIGAIALFLARRRRDDGR